MVGVLEFIPNAVRDGAPIDEVFSGGLSLAAEVTGSPWTAERDGCVYAASTRRLCDISGGRCGCFTGDMG